MQLERLAMSYDDNADEEYELTPWELAQARLQGPAWGLIVTGLMGMVANVVIAVGWVIVAPPAAPTRPPNMPDAEWQGYQVGYKGAQLIWPGSQGCAALFVYPLILVGGVTMLNPRSRAFPTLGAILAMLPCGVAWVVTGPMGLWSLLAIHHPDVLAVTRKRR